ncbi:MAG: hypothetical protein JW999_05165 [Methanotrichaceae archaeon]|nr:hypothetical protein [Methanotrichaceae archaeon]
MKLCIVGIGGAGGRITKEFLGNEDLDFQLLSSITGAEYVSPSKLQGIWLEADKSDTERLQPFFGDMKEGCYPCFYIPHDVVPEGSDVHVAVTKKYGYDVKKQGFVRDAQYLKAIFEIFDTDKEIQDLVTKTMNKETIEPMGENDADNGASSAPNPIFDSAWGAIRDFTNLGKGECDGILFVVSFGGGTGTGTINPIINHIRKEGKSDYPVFVLGILTESGIGSDKAQFAKSGRRNLAAISAIYDLLTKGGGANGVIIVDNEILLERFGDDFSSANRFIHKMMQPMVAGRNYPDEDLNAQAFAEHSGSLPKPPIFVPLFASLPRSANPEEELIKKALSKEGRLFGCTPEKSDFAMVFCRGFMDSNKIKKILSNEAHISPDRIWPIRKMGEGQNEILILLRNPYGGESIAYKNPGTLENRFCQVISEALQYISQQSENLYYKGKEENGDKGTKPDEQVKLTQESITALKNFFFGVDGNGITSGFAFELKEARKRLRDGYKPFFETPLRIFNRKVKDDRKKIKTGDEKRYKDEIARAVDERIKELIEQGLIKGS